MLVLVPAAGGLSLGQNFLQAAMCAVQGVTRYIGESHRGAGALATRSPTTHTHTHTHTPALHAARPGSCSVADYSLQLGTYGWFSARRHQLPFGGGDAKTCNFETKRRHRVILCSIVISFNSNLMFSLLAHRMGFYHSTIPCASSSCSRCRSVAHPSDRGASRACGSPGSARARLARPGARAWPPTAGPSCHRARA